MARRNSDNAEASNQAQSPSYESDETIGQNPQDDGPNAPVYSLAGPRQPIPNQGFVYLHPEYRRYNPRYGQQDLNGPVWSLAQPLPRVVRSGMRSNEVPRDEKGRPNTRVNPEPASNEPPTDEPAGKEHAEEQREAEKSPSKDDEFFNAWGKVRHYFRQELAEWLGVTVAVTLGLCAGFSTYTSQNQAGSFASLAAAWGFAYMIAIYVSGGVSGGHLNPAITISMSVWRGFPARRCMTYVLAQIIGAITATGIAYAIYHDAIVQVGNMNQVPQDQSPAKQAMVTAPKEFVHPAAAFFTEFVGTAILVGTILALGDDTNAPPGAGMNAFIIGVLITVLMLALGYNTGGCFNPARDFGARLVAVMAGWGGRLFGEQDAWWIWGPWVADVFGGLFGGFLYDLAIFSGGESPINYPPPRLKRALLLKERNALKRLHFRRRKIQDLERAADEIEH